LRGGFSCSLQHIPRIATANRPSDRGGKPGISNIGLQLRKNWLIVDQPAASIITLLAQLSGPRENARVSIGKHLPDWDEKAMEINRADVAELVDARDLKSLDGNIVWVRVPPPAPRFAPTGYAWRSHARPLARSVSGVA
jgi:hypothetical protein